MGMSDDGVGRGSDCEAAVSWHVSAGISPKKSLFTFHHFILIFVLSNTLMDEKL